MQMDREESAQTDWMFKLIKNFTRRSYHFDGFTTLMVSGGPMLFVYLRNEFNFLMVHKIMNTSGLLQSK